LVRATLVRALVRRIQRSDHIARAALCRREILTLSEVVSDFCARVPVAGEKVCLALARETGLRELIAEVLPDNVAMLKV
jgi:hypothetical protein